MVEGPGNKLKGEKMKATVVGQKVKRVGGSDKGVAGVRFKQLVDKTVSDVRTLGKELFMVFDSDLCLRVHFLMSGYVRYNLKPSDPDESAASKAKAAEETPPRLKLQLDRDLVTLHSCSVDIRPADLTLQRWDSMISLDICWSGFDPARALALVLEPAHKDRMVADVLMDQAVLPGVGNIIKNEACFNAGVNPLSLIKDLVPALLKRLVKMTRDFSIIFYNCRKTGKPLWKHYKMYRFDNCKECGTKVTKCHPGEYKRGTYFCPKCQDNRLEVGPARGTLLGWCTSPAPAVQGTASSPSWSCPACTLVNKGGNLCCSVCGQARQAVAKRKVEEQGQGGGKRPRLGEDRVLQPSSVNGNTEVEAVKEVCKGHGKPCVVKMVSKEGENKLRLFHSCSLPREKQCQHFSWADSHHPRCKCGSVTIVREVYKLNQNNGRKFYICPKPKKDQCTFFEWAS